MNIEYKVFSPGEGDRTKFQDFIIGSNDWFIPRLSEQTDLSTYATKLFDYGTKYLCYDDEKIVGAVVAYINKIPKFSFGSYMVVNPQYDGMGLGFHLILKAIKDAEDCESVGFKLKMRSSNKMLLKFYMRLGFEVTGENFYPNSVLTEYELTKIFK